MTCSATSARPSGHSFATCSRRRSRGTAPRRRPVLHARSLSLVVPAVCLAGCWPSGIGSGERADRDTRSPVAPATPHRADAKPVAPPKTPVDPEPGPINTAFAGLTTFRGNATRNYYGEGPVPARPEVKWRYPADGGLCSRSEDIDGTELWCGTGWTGQPNVIQHGDGTVEVRIGAFDGHY